MAHTHGYWFWLFHCFSFCHCSYPNYSICDKHTWVTVMMMMIMMMTCSMREPVWLAGSAMLDRLCRDPQFQQCLDYIDRLAPHSEAGCGGGDTDVERTAEHRLERINRDIQRRVKRVQDIETAFRLSCHLFDLFVFSL